MPPQEACNDVHERQSCHNEQEQTEDSAENGRALLNVGRCDEQGQNEQREAYARTGSCSRR